MRLLTVRIITFLAALIGIGDSILSTLDHLRLHVAGTLKGGYCQVILAGGCKSAHTSQWSELFHVPISVYGIGFYFTITALLFMMFSRRMRQAALGLGLGISGLSLLYCVFLGYILYRSGNFCPLCAILYAVNIVLVTGLYIQIRIEGLHPLKNIGKTLWSGTSALAGTIFAAVTLIAFLIYGNALNAGRAHKSHTGIIDTAGMGLPSIGPVDAPIRVVEVSDFLCPYCAGFFQNLEKVREEMPAKVRVSFMQYPLDECNEYVGRAFHPGACVTAAAALCANKHKKFWEYARILYKNRHNHTIRELSGYAAGLGIDKKAFEECVLSPATTKTIRDQTRQAHKIGVRGTPTFIVNNRVFVGAKKKAALRGIFKDALRKKNE